MSAPEAVILDAGVGNLGNLQRALSHLGSSSQITSDPGAIAAARCLLLPGVGAFRPPRETLRGPLEAALKRAVAEGAWLLGICVGFQLLFERGEEFGTTDGLALLEGSVTRLPETVALPHIGWNRLDVLPCQDQPEQQNQPDALVEGLDGAYFYFVHSFAPEGVPEKLTLATAQHGRCFPAVAGKGRVLGTQFHPEKSGAAGLRLLANFLEIVDER
ncbi:MAG: imidazole glycerol phosphate synthase subunit HisH [Deltaproteobacteria bacterium]|nr:imidazole glycerol phosphate synthase subunit HisH [Deltaproteobacteria bacterium]